MRCTAPGCRSGTSAQPSISTDAKVAARVRAVMSRFMAIILAEPPVASAQAGEIRPRGPRAVLALFQFRQDLEYLVVGDEAARVRDPDVANDTLFIDHKPRAFRPQIAGNSLRILRHGRIVVEHAIGARHLP